MYQAYKLREGAINFEIIESENKNKALLYELDNKRYYKPLVVRKYEEVELIACIRNGNINLLSKHLFEKVANFYSECVRLDVTAPVLIIVNVTE